MSQKELLRLKILNLVIDKRITQKAGAQKLGISDRQVRNLIVELRKNGEKGIISKKRGKRGNRQLSKEIKSRTLSIVRKYYEDFGPKLANEYLKKNYDIKISTETLRQWMIEKHMWVPRESRKKRRHLPRERRMCFGELIQGDGSHHDWFEGRSAPCGLMVFIDDATSVITSLHFCESETLEAYYHTLEKHLKNYGIPLGFYGDRCSVLMPRTPGHGSKGTQFKRTLDELGCELILAQSAQAKGRVERVNRTLQDRLVKELRLRGISSISEANAMLEEYRTEHNRKFSKKPSEQKDAHRPLDGISLKNVLSIREERTLSKDYIVQFRNTFYEISSQEKNIHLYKGAEIEVRETLDGERVALFKGRVVSMTSLAEINVADEKKILEWKSKRKYIPPNSHPYKRKHHKSRKKDEIFEKVV